MTNEQQTKSADRTLILATLKGMAKVLKTVASHVQQEEMLGAINSLTGLRADAAAICNLLEMARAREVAAAAQAYEDEAAAQAGFEAYNAANEPTMVLTSDQKRSAFFAGQQAAWTRKDVANDEAWKPFTDWAVANGFTQHTIGVSANMLLWKDYQIGWESIRLG